MFTRLLNAFSLAEVHWPGVHGNFVSGSSSYSENSESGIAVTRVVDHTSTRCLVFVPQGKSEHPYDEKKSGVRSSLV